MEMFDPVVDKAFGLIKDQVDQLKKEDEEPFKIIAMCGGLGSSAYVFERFEQYCKTELIGSVKVVRDRRPWSAVVRGAAVRGLEGSMVISKRARRAYGLSLHRKFDPNIHKEEYTYRCPVKGKRAKGYIDWQVKKVCKQRFITSKALTNAQNDMLLPNTKKTWRAYLAIADDEDDLLYTWNLYGSYADGPPARVDDPGTLCSYSMVGKADVSLGVEKIGQITLDLTGYAVRLRKRQKTASSKDNTQEVDINLNLTLASERGYLEIKAFHEKVKVGSAKIEYGKDKVHKAPRLPGAR
jgi:hypothetical protein